MWEEEEEEEEAFGSAWIPPGQERGNEAKPEARTGQKHKPGAEGGPILKPGSSRVGFHGILAVFPFLSSENPTWSWQSSAFPRRELQGFQRQPPGRFLGGSDPPWGCPSGPSRSPGENSHFFSILAPEIPRFFPSSILHPSPSSALPPPRPRCPHGVQ